MIEEGKQAPDFSLTDAQGNTHKLSDYLGKKIVLYFYPKDDTPGCTIQACDFRDHFKDFSSKNAVIIGISPDSEESHQNFLSKYKLPFLLLSDPEKKVMIPYKAWGERNLYGRKFMGVIRSTVVIDEKGIILKHYKRARAKGHVEKVLATL